MGHRTKKVGLTRGLGPRYGVTLRKRYMKVVEELRRPHACPHCGFARVKRESVGIWRCRKCGHTYAGGAYSPTTKLGIVAKRVAKGAPVEETMKAAVAESTPVEDENA